MKREWLVRLRGKMSQTKLAELVGVSQQTICAIETGTRRPSVGVAQDLARVLDFEKDGKSWTFFYEKY